MLILGPPVKTPEVLEEKDIAKLGQIASSVGAHQCALEVYTTMLGKFS